MTAFLGLDVGTSACKGLLLRVDGTVGASVRSSYRLDLPGPGRIELDPEAVWQAVASVIRRLATRAAGAGLLVRSLSVSASGDEAVAVDARAEPVGPAIMSMDTRSAAEATRLARDLGSEHLYAVTGLPVHAMYPLVRLVWLRDHQPSAFEQVRQMLAWPEFIASRLGVPPAAEPSLAGRTMAFDILRRTYDREILAAAGLPDDIFAPVIPSGSILGEVAPTVGGRLGLPSGVAVVAGGFDQAMAAFGAGVTEPGMVHVGTGSWEAVTTLAATPILTEAMHRSGFSFGCAVGGSAAFTAMASSAGGTVLHWLRDLVTPPGARSHPSFGRLLAAAPDHPTNLLVLSHFEGSYSPWMDPASRGAIAGLDLATDRGTLIRALMEGVTFELRENLERLRVAGLPATELRATGGGARSAAWLQLKADVTGLPVVRPSIADTGALAAACVAAAAFGAFGSPEAAVRAIVRPAERHEPRPALVAAYDERFARHRRLYPALRAWREASGA